MALYYDLSVFHDMCKPIVAFIGIVVISFRFPSHF